MQQTQITVRTDHDGVIRFNGVINPADVTRASFDLFDRLLLRECEKSRKASDKVLALELIYRRIEESKDHG